MIRESLHSAASNRCMLRLRICRSSSQSMLFLPLEPGTSPAAPPRYICTPHSCRIPARVYHVRVKRTLSRSGGKTRYHPAILYATLRGSPHHAGHPIDPNTPSRCCRHPPMTHGSTPPHTCCLMGVAIRTFSRSYFPRLFGFQRFGGMTCIHGIRSWSEIWLGRDQPRLRGSHRSRPVQPEILALKHAHSGCFRNCSLTNSAKGLSNCCRVGRSVGQR